MTSDNRFVDEVVRSMSEYLTLKSSTAHFDMRLEDLIGQVEAKLSDSYGQEMVARFKEKPHDNAEANTLRIHLGRAIDEDAEFRKRLALTFGGRAARSVRRRKWLVGAAALVVVAALGGVYLLGRTGGSGASASSPPSTVTSTVIRTVTDAATPTSNPTSTMSSTPTPSASSSAKPESGIPGDGSTVPAGQPVPLGEVPRPNGEWRFDYGDHDVQFKLYNNSMWAKLSTCGTGEQSREQQFRLKNFNRIEIKAVGMDSTADPGLIVKFDVFVNNDTVHPLKSVVVNPGEAPELKENLPPDVFALTLRMSLTRSGKPCESGNAVWGEPYVVATGG